MNFRLTVSKLRDPFGFRRSFLSAAFIIFALAPNCLAQLLPVARLAGSVPETNYSRPRRASESSSAAVAVKLSTLPSIEEASSIERTAFEKTNQARVVNGKAPLAWDAELCRMARLHSELMATMNFFSHETPDGLHLKERARNSGIARFRVIGENIAYNKGSHDPGAFAVERWLTSSGHRANMLYIGFQASAVGSYVSPDGSVYLTQVFIGR